MNHQTAALLTETGPGRLQYRGTSRSSLSINPILRLAFLAFVFFLSFELGKDGVLPFQPPTIFAALFVAAAFLQRRYSFQRPPLAFWWFVLFVCLFSASFVLHGIQHESWFFYCLTHLILLVSLLPPACQLLRHDDLAKQALWLFIASTVVVAALVASTVSSWQSQRATVLGQNPADLAGNLSLGTVALMGLVFGGSKRDWRFNCMVWPLFALMGSAIVATGSRGPLTALGAGVLVFTLGGGGRWAKLRNTGFIILFVAMLVQLSTRSETMLDRLDQSAAGNWSVREVIYPTAWQLFLEAPLFGWGPVHNEYELQYRVQYPRYESLSSHNLVLEVLNGTGILGAIPLLVGIFLCLHAAWRARAGAHGMLPLALLVTALMVNMSMDWLYSKAYWFVLAYALGRASAVSGRAVLRTGRPANLFGRRRIQPGIGGPYSGRAPQRQDTSEAK